MTKEIQIEDVAEFFSAFSDPTRLKILLTIIREKEVCVNKIVENLEISQPAISQQLRILKNSGIVKTRRDGQFIRYLIADEVVKEFIKIAIEHVLGENYEL